MVSLVKLCRWLGFPRRSLYYRPKSRKRAINADLAVRVKLALERFPTYGYRRLACVLGENRKPIQRILQMKGWQVRKWPQGFRPRARSLPSVTSRPDERWATDLTHVWCGKNRRASLAVIIDCCTRETLGWRLSDNGSSKTAEATLEEALIYRLGALGRVQQPLALRSDNGLVFSSRHYKGTVKAYGLIKNGAQSTHLRPVNSVFSPILIRYAHPSGQPSAVTPYGRCALSNHRSPTFQTRPRK